MPTTLLTGGNGYVGSAILSQLLSQSPPHHVICTIRRSSAGDDLLSTHPDWDPSLISFATVPDFTQAGAFDYIFKDHPEIDYIIHCAAPLVADPQAIEFVEHFEKPNVLGSLGLLTSAHKYGSNVKAISVTGSINSITTGAQEDISSRILTSKEWLPYTRDDAVKMQDNFISYCVGKKVGEEAIWKFAAEERPKFHVSVFLPTLIFGPMQQKVGSIDTVNFSMGQVYSILNSGKAESGTVPNTMFPGYVDVRDLAHLQIASLTTPLAANRRFLIGHAFTYDMFADAMRQGASGLASRVGKNNGEKIALPKIDTSEVEEVFGYKGKWKSIQETAGDSARDLVRVEALGN